MARTVYTVRVSLPAENFPDVVSPTYTNLFRLLAALVDSGSIRRPMGELSEELAGEFYLLPPLLTQDSYTWAVDTAKTFQGYGFPAEAYPKNL